MNQSQKFLLNRQLNKQLANVSRQKTLAFFANLYNPTPPFETWRQFLLAGSKGKMGYISKDIYRKRLSGLREARVQYSLAKRGAFSALYEWWREAKYE